jgi:hypothetical protein
VSRWHAESAKQKAQFQYPTGKPLRIPRSEVLDLFTHQRRTSVRPPRRRESR